MEEILVCRGRKLEHLRSDNGPEFVALRVQHWAKNGQIDLSYIQPGSPWENGNVESFHASLRAELLDRELFFSVAEANVMLGNWREEYNTKRAHGSLGYMSPEAAAKREFPLRATPCAPVPAGKSPQTTRTKLIGRIDNTQLLAISNLHGNWENKDYLLTSSDCVSLVEAYAGKLESEPSSKHFHLLRKL